MKCEVIPIDLKLKREFIVAGGSESLKRNFVFIIDGSGLGEAAGSVHYGVSTEEIENDLNIAAERLAGCDDSIPTETFAELERLISPPAICAVSTAWLDRKAKANRIPLYQYLRLEAPAKLPTSITVSVGDTSSLSEQLDSGIHYVKLKMNDDINLNNQIIEAVNNSKNTKFRIDANGSWGMAETERIVSLLAVDKIDFIEQPFGPEAVDDWKLFGEQSPIPLIMDESIVGADDVKRVAQYVDGINIKIQKSGRLESAVEAITVARSLGLKIMIGCMIESSLGIAAAYHLSGAADYLDLDGRLLIDGDPFSGLAYDRGELKLSNDYGHGISFA